MANIEAIAAPLRQATAGGTIPGVAAAAATRDGIIFADAFGVRDLATGLPMTADTVVWIASMTKAVTGACAMQLVEQGKLSLDADLSSLLPELGRVQVLEGFDTQDAPRLRPPKRAITLRHLLTHTAGFAYEMWNDKIARFMQVTGTPSVGSCLNAALMLPLVDDPGARWDYGISIDWVGKAVEAISGQTLANYMHENLLAPLGMNDTGFRIGLPQRARLAKVHARTPDGLVVTDHELPQEPEFHMGGGGLYSTVTDYLRFTRMILGAGALDGVRVLKPETVTLMSRNGMGDIACRPMKTTAASISGNVDFIDGMKWGLSFLINPEPLPTGRSAGSLAWAGLANSYYWIDPMRGVTGVYATQVLPFFDPAAVAAFEGFEAAVYQAVAG